MASFGNLDDLKVTLGIALTNTTEDVRLQQWLDEWSAIIEDYCDREFVPNVVYVQPLSGNGTAYQTLRNRPIRLYVLDGTANGTTTISGLSSTANLIVGMPVCQAQLTGGQIPVIVPGTTMTAKTSTTVTLSTAATGSGSITLGFGVSVWLDDGAYWGQTSQAFATTATTTTQLNLGTDWELILDGTDLSTSKGGLLYSENGIWDNQWVHHPGNIVPFKENGAGNIKVQYMAGDTPQNVLTALYMQIAWIRNIAQRGQQINSESYSDKVGSYSYGLGGPESKVGYLTPVVTGLLSKMRNVAIS